MRAWARIDNKAAVRDREPDVRASLKLKNVE
jgi:hypothetical protein